MKHIQRVLETVLAILADSWGSVRAALTSGRRVTASLVQFDTIRRSYALGAASREQFEAAVRELDSSVRHAARLGSRRSRRAA